MCPPGTCNVFRFCCRLVAADGTFLKARFIETLLLAIGVDANGAVVILAWAVVESENLDLWEWFLALLQQSIPEVVEEACVFISDRDKGLLAAEQTLGPRVMTAYCCFHLRMNFEEKFGRALRGAFWRCACAMSIEAFEAGIHALRIKKPEAAAWLLNVEPAVWARCAFPGCR